VLSLASSRAGAVVFGTLKSGIGVARAGDGARLLAIDQVPDANSAMVLSLAETRPGTWWAATYGGGVIEFDTSGHGRRIVHRPAMPISLAHDRVAAIWRDRSGLVWVANERGVDIHNPANHSVDTILDGVGLPEISAFAFMSDSAGRLWVALGDQGIDLIAPDGSRRAGLRPDPLRPDSALPNRLILNMVEAEPQEAWIGTAMGLYHTSAKGRRVSRVALPQAIRIRASAPCCARANCCGWGCPAACCATTCAAAAPRCTARARRQRRPDRQPHHRAARRSRRRAVGRHPQRSEPL
jgi:hypothetical protein